MSMQINPFFLCTLVADGDLAKPLLVDGDDEDLFICGKVRLDVMAELRALDVTVLPVKQEQGLVDFARH